MRFSPAILLSIFNCLVAQYALCSNSTDKWYAFLNTSLNGDFPNGVLNAVLYAHSASSIFFTKYFFELLSVFSKIYLISLFDTSAWPLVYGWYASVVRCRTPYFLNTLSISLLHKCVPPSVINALGVPNRVNI